MKPEDRALFLQELAKLALIYRGFAASDPVAALWWQTLVDVEIGDMQRAVAEFMRGVDDFPTPGKIRSLAEPCGLSQQEFSRILHAQKRPKMKVIMPND